MRLAPLLAAICGVGMVVSVGCGGARRTPLPPPKTSSVGLQDTYERVRSLPIWAPHSGGYQVMAGSFWAIDRPMRVGSRILLYSPRTGIAIEQFTRPDACPAAHLLTEAERKLLSEGGTVVKVVAGRAAGWAKVGNAWVFATAHAKGLPEVRRILKEYLARYDQYEAELRSWQKKAGELGKALEPGVRGEWDYTEYDSLITPP